MCKLASLLPVLHYDCNLFAVPGLLFFVLLLLSLLTSSGTGKAALQSSSSPQMPGASLSEHNHDYTRHGHPPLPSSSGSSDVAGSTVWNEGGRDVENATCEGHVALQLMQRLLYANVCGLQWYRTPVE